MSSCFTISVTPGGPSFSAEAGEVVMAAANRAGLYWPTICGAEALCAACRFRTADEAGLDPPDTEEAAALARAGRSAPGDRLACRAVVKGDVVAEVRRVRPARAGDRLPFA